MFQTTSKACAIYQVYIYISLSLSLSIAISTGETDFGARGEQRSHPTNGEAKRALNTGSLNRLHPRSSNSRSGEPCELDALVCSIFLRLELPSDVCGLQPCLP